MAGIDKVITMSTYTWGDISFMNHVLWITWFIKLDNTGIGLCPWPWCLAHAKVTPTQAQLQYRFDAISQFGFNEIDVWMVGPVSLWARVDGSDPKLLAALDSWIPFLADFLAAGGY